MQASTTYPPPQPRVALFVTCLVDLFRPVVGFAAVKLLENSGLDVIVPETQTCCGQPGYNSGDRDGAIGVARKTIATLEGFDYIVVPSGSCAGMIRHHYPQLFAGDAEWESRAIAVAERCYELTQFLKDMRNYVPIGIGFPGTVTYHDSCSSLREMNVRDQPRALLKQVAGLKISELAEADACCGFGGTFCVKFPDISNSMVERKTADIKASGADTVLAADLGCLMNLAGKLQRQGSPVRARHVAEVLAGMADGPAIGEAS